MEALTAATFPGCRVRGGAVQGQEVARNLEAEATLSSAQTCSNNPRQSRQGLHQMEWVTRG